jgi:hypothetical protein
MRALVVFLSVMLVVDVCVEAASCLRRDHLFWIERSRNKNRVQYDVCLLPTHEPLRKGADHSQLDPHIQPFPSNLLQSVRPGLDPGRSGESSQIAF